MKKMSNQTKDDVMGFGMQDRIDSFLDSLFEEYKEYFEDRDDFDNYLANHFDIRW